MKVIHARTKQEHEQVQKKLFSLGHRWGGSEGVRDYWGEYQERSVIFVIESNLSFASVEYAEKIGEKIIPAREFLGNKKTKPVKKVYAI